MNRLTGGITYYDYASINPDRLTLAFLKTAQKNGAVLANYAKVEKLLKEGDRVVGVTVTDQLTQASTTVRAKWVVNCAGAWVDEVVRGEKEELRSPRQRSEGVHLITSKFRCHCAVGIQTIGGQHLLMMPWRGLTIVGPTDRAYYGQPSEYRTTRESLEELIENINAHVPAEKMGGAFSRRDILFHYGGLRPLVDSGEKGDTYKASRRHEIVNHLSRDGLAGLISVEGGKYTTSRGLAEQVLKLIGKLSQWNVHRSDTSRIPLSGCLDGKYHEFQQKLSQKFGKHYQPSTIDYYASNYGSEAVPILDQGLGMPDGMQLLTADGEIMAEVDYVLERELVFGLADLLLRRTGVGWMGQPTDNLMECFAAKLGTRLGWSREQRQQAIEHFINTAYTLP